jgi:CHAT domain-containing protein
MDDPSAEEPAISPDEFIARLRRIPDFANYTDEQIAETLLQGARQEPDSAEAHVRFDHAIVMAQHTGQHDVEYQARLEQGYLYGGNREYDRAHACFRAALALASEAGNDAWIAACQLAEADTFFNERLSDESLRLYQLALDSGTLAATSMAHARTNQGQLWLEKGRCRDALEAFAQADAAGSSAVGWEGSARAQQLAAQARAECEPSLDEDLTVALIAAFEREATTAFDAGDFHAARSWYARLLALFQRLGHAELQAATLRNAGRSETELAMFAEAASHTAAALTLYEGLGHHDGIAICQWQLGDIARLRGDSDAALDHLTLAMTSLRLCSDSTRDAILSSLGLTYGQLGHYRLALGCHGAVYDLAMAPGDEERLRRSLNNLGLTWWNLGDLARAGTCLREAMTLHRQAARPSASMASCLNNLGAVYFSQGDLVAAIETFSEAVDVSRAFNRRRDEGVHVANLGAALALQPGRRDSAISACDDAVRIAQSVGDQATAGRCLTTLGRLASTEGDLTLGAARFRAALDIAMQLRITADILPCLISLSAVTYESGDYADAHQLSERAIDLAERTGDAHALELALENHGLACLRLGQMKEARGSLERAIELIERLRIAAGGLRRERMLRFGSLWKPYVALIEEILLPAGEIDAAFSCVERLKARTLLEKLQAHDRVVPSDVPLPLAAKYRDAVTRRRQLELALSLPDATIANRNTAIAWAQWRDVDADMRTFDAEIETISPGFSRLTNARPLSAGEIQNSLGADDVALVEFFMSNRAIYAFVMTRTEGLQLAIAECPTSDVIDITRRWATAYERFRESVEYGPWFACMDDVLQRLHQMVFRPVGRLLPSTIRNLVFVPHHAFHLFPLHAMYEMRGGERRYLIDDFDSVSYSPSAAALVACHQRTRPTPELLVAIDNPTSDLRFAAREVAVVAPMFTRTTLLGPTRRHPADVQNVVRETQGAHVVLVAAHATSGDSGAARVRLTDVAMTLDELFGMLDVPLCSLWDFDGCETGLPPADVADEWITLASAPLCAGAATVWSSLWVVDDEATCQLKIAAYRQLLGGTSRARALNEAQRALRRQKAGGGPLAADDGHVHPFFWAGFTSTGAR